MEYRFGIANVFHHDKNQTDIWDGRSRGNNWLNCTWAGTIDIPYCIFHYSPWKKLIVLGR